MEIDLHQRFGGDGEGLILTPLLDMFMIVLFFLIMTFEAEDKGFEPDGAVDLPKSRARAPLEAAVDITITADELLVEKDAAVSLTDGRFDPTHYESGRIPPLVDKLEAYNAAITEGDPLEDGYRPEADRPILLVQADRELTYESLHLVLRSASLAGFDDYRLAIRKS